MSQNIVSQEKTVGRITEKVTVQNYVDMFMASTGELDPSQVRTVEVDAIVDTGASHLCLPPAVVEQLGLLYSHSKPVTSANGIVERRVFGGAEITILGRNVQMSVMENDESKPPLIGYLILESLDFVVGPKSQCLIPNPEHEGRWMADLY